MAHGSLEPQPSALENPEKLLWLDGADCGTDEGAGVGAERLNAELTFGEVAFGETIEGLAEEGTAGEAIEKLRRPLVLLPVFG